MRAPALSSCTRRVGLSMAQMRSHHQLAFFLSLGAIMFAGCRQSDPLDTLAQGETGRVVRIIDGDALVLDTGLSVRLVGLEAPAPERYNRAGEPYADASARLLEDLVICLLYTSPSPRDQRGSRMPSSA